LPCYLIYPYRGERAERENEARLVAWELTDLEASAAAQLFEVVTSLDIYDSHLRVYEAVVHEAEEFWDQLALYLPVAQGRRLTRVRKLIELVHQTLLQSIADLDQVAIQITEEARKVERLRHELKDSFDQHFTERPLPCLQEAPSIRSSLTETGYFDKATRHAQRVYNDTIQVRRSYTTVLDGIERAFDEQRVRGIDVLQRVGIGLAMLAVVFGFVPEALNVIFGWWDPTLLALLTTVGIVGFGTFGSMVLWRMRRLRTLGSRRFRPHHKQLQEFLASCATDRLTRFREDGWKRVRATLDEPSKSEGSAWNEFFAEWNKRDYELARQCAELLDELGGFEVSESTWSDRTPRLGDLARQVERWALKALLVSERPRQFWKFALPRLTFLYRFFPMMGSELVSSPIEEPKVDLVSDADFTLTISNRCSGDHEQIGQIKDWAKRQLEQSKSATDFVEALDEVGLRAGMTRRDFEAMLERMRSAAPSSGSSR
ncbi:hypothetical protein, partial [Novosphingobium sp.]|uniref:hypothetical protein n=1 Tax=Novosphingobium sp. TaxID=1874826 RepID=UPI003D6C81D6